MRGVSIRHNFETAHRLPHLGDTSKCFNLHGHSWEYEVVIVADETDERGMVVEFGALKKLMRSWSDLHLDHGTMLGSEDPLLPVLRTEGCKVWEFEGGWPTVEAVAELIAAQCSLFLFTVPRAPDARVLRVIVRETAVNSAMWGEW